MRRALYGVGVVLLLLLGFNASEATAQQSGRSAGFQLRGNYPNPFNPHTTIPFELNQELFDANGGRPVVVSIKIFNALHQLVAVPVALDHPQGGSPLVDNLMYTEPGLKKAFWDGKARNGDSVASGVYWIRLYVNGKATLPRKMVVTK